MSSDTYFNAGIHVEVGKSPSETKKHGINGKGAFRKQSLIQAAVESVKIPGKYDMPKPRETPPHKER